MTELTERLRNWPATAPRKDAFSSHFVGAMLVEAADEIDRLRSIAVERMDLFKQAASKVEEADALLLAFVAAYQQQDADNFTDAMRNVYAAADLFVSGDDVSSQKEPS